MIMISPPHLNLTHHSLKIRNALEASQLLFLVECGILPLCHGACPPSRAGEALESPALELGHGAVLVWTDDNDQSRHEDLDLDSDAREWHEGVERYGLRTYRAREDGSTLWKVCFTARRNTIYNEPGKIYWHMVAYYDAWRYARPLRSIAEDSEWSDVLKHMPEGYFVPVPIGISRSTTSKAPPPLQPVVPVDIVSSSMMNKPLELDLIPLPSSFKIQRSVARTLNAHQIKEEKIDPARWDAEKDRTVRKHKGVSTDEYDEDILEKMYLPHLLEDEGLMLMDEEGNLMEVEVDEEKGREETIPPKPKLGPERIPLSTFIDRFFLSDPSMSARLRTQARHLANDAEFMDRLHNLQNARWQQSPPGAKSADMHMLARDALLLLLMYVSSQVSSQTQSTSIQNDDEKVPHRFWRARIDDRRPTNRDGSIVLVSAPGAPASTHGQDYEVDLDDFRTASTFVRLSLSTSEQNADRDERGAFMNLMREMGVSEDRAPQWMRNLSGVSRTKDGEMGEDVERDVRWLSRRMLAGCVARRNVFGLVYIHEEPRAPTSDSEEESTGGGSFWTTYVDRGGAVVGGPITLASLGDRDNLDALAMVLTAIHSSSLCGRGLHDAFTYAGSSDAAPGGPFHEDLLNLIVRLDPWTFQMEATVDPGKDESDMYQTVRYLARKVSGPPLLTNPGSSKNATEQAVLSFRWGPDLSQDEEDQSEDQWHRYAHEHGVHGVARLIRSYVLPAKQFPGWERDAQERIATMLCVSVMEPYVPLDSVDDPIAFKRAFISLVKTHRNLRKAGLMHRNITPPALMVRANDQHAGVLIGLDNACRRFQPMTNLRSDEPESYYNSDFAAVDLLRRDSDENRARTLYRYELESFFYSLTWLVCRDVYEVEGLLDEPIENGARFELFEKVIEYGKMEEHARGNKRYQTMKKALVGLAEMWITAYRERKSEDDDKTMGGRVDYDVFMRNLRL